jgi:glutathione S-transferase
VKLNFPQAGNIANYMQRVASRPAVAAAMAAEGI